MIKVHDYEKEIDQLVYSSIDSLQVVRFTPSKGGQARRRKLQLWRAKMNEDKFIRQQTWTQTVVSQYAIRATLSGLEMNALILFATFYRNELSSLQKIIFVLSLVLICMSVWCIIWMVTHERRLYFTHITDCEFLPIQNNIPDST